MKKLLFLTMLVFAPFLTPQAYAEIPQVEKYIQGAQKTGEARLKYLMWNVYDATLYTPNAEYNNTEPFALKLDYLMGLQGKDIADRSIEEIEKQGFNDQDKLNKWAALLDEIFPDVNKGVSITGVRDNKGHTIFYKNNERIGYIDDPEFTKCFFDIWLGDKTSEPVLRQQLLGLN